MARVVTGRRLAAISADLQKWHHFPGKDVERATVNAAGTVRSATHWDHMQESNMKGYQ
jgi:hypothetical protein